MGGEIDITEKVKFVLKGVVYHLGKIYRAVALSS